MDILWWISYLMCVVCSLLKTSALTDSITSSKSLKDGDTLVSSGGSFELGFFSPGVSTDRYLGIWYNNIPIKTYVWVANRLTPIKDLSGSLKINTTGSLLLSDGNNTVVWSSTSIRAASQDSVAQLLDSGNFVLRENNNYLWQSFDYPSDTLLPDMKFGWDLRTSLNRRLSSWKSPDDPSPGEMSHGIVLDPDPQSLMLKGTRKYYRGGPWIGQRFSGAPELRSNPVFIYEFIWNQEEVYYTYQLVNKSVISRVVLNETTASRQRYVWAETDQTWKLYASIPRDYCDNYGLCGANGICDISESPVCQCLKGFEPKIPLSWNATDWSQGCVRSEPLDCKRKNNFVRFRSLKVPNTENSWVSKSMTLKECREACFKNCSCNAYTNLDVSGGQGSGCVLWFGDLVDIRKFADGGQDLYIRISASNRAKRTVVIVAVVVTIASSFGGLLLIYYYFFRGKMRSKGKTENDGSNNVAHKEDLDLPLLDLVTVSRATDNFSINKKLGEGGFGPVYKGLLVDGKSIAVKRLSKSSGQGQNEFKNEVKLIAKLQHRNLVKLLGCCIDDDEKILIYEYMPNGSLDSCLFGQTRGTALDWPKRFNIICGIARGLLYLHQDSRLRIIHRDLKTSNVLLDNELNPKISDFGMARTFGGDQSEESTGRIVGTYGYMAPEYASYGSFSVKSDVFSYGILLLEIVSGRKNRGFAHPQNHSNLMGYAWKLWTEGRPMDLIDSLLDDVLIETEMIRCINVALLCVQRNPEDRPIMSTVVLMLNGESVLPHPKQPGYFPTETSSSPSKKDSCSVNGLTITDMEAR